MSNVGTSEMVDCLTSVPNCMIAKFTWENDKTRSDESKIKAENKLLDKQRLIGEPRGN